jgi:hypothetical protein
MQPQERKGRARCRTASNKGGWQTATDPYFETSASEVSIFSVASTTAQITLKRLNASTAGLVMVYPTATIASSAPNTTAPSSSNIGWILGGSVGGVVVFVYRQVDIVHLGGQMWDVWLVLHPT